MIAHPFAHRAQPADETRAPGEDSLIFCTKSASAPEIAPSAASSLSSETAP